MGVGAAGGFAVPKQFRTTLLENVPWEEGPLRRKSLVLPPADPPDAAIDLPVLDYGTTHWRYAGWAVEWISEGAEKPPTDLYLRSLKLEPHEVAASLVMTDRLLRNWPTAGSVIEQMARNCIIGTEELAFVSGNGVGKSLGLLDPANAAANYGEPQRSECDCMGRPLYNVPPDSPSGEGAHSGARLFFRPEES